MIDWWTRLSWSEAAFVLCAMGMALLAIVVAIFEEE